MKDQNILIFHKYALGFVIIFHNNCRVIPLPSSDERGDFQGGKICVPVPSVFFSLELPFLSPLSFGSAKERGILKRGIPAFDQMRPNRPACARYTQRIQGVSL